MSITIGLVQLNTGTGRSTLATSLAAGLSALHPSKPSSVTIIDCDPHNPTSSMWCMLRGDSNIRAIDAASFDEFKVAIVKARAQSDYVIIDGPRRDPKMSAAIAQVADLTLVPMRAFPPDAKKESMAVQLVEKYAQPNAWRIVWNQSTAGVPFLPLAQVRGKPALNTVFANRSRHKAALMSGQTVHDYDDTQAAAEVDALVSEVVQLAMSPMDWAAETLRL